MNAILNFIGKFKAKPFIQIFTIYLRYLIGAAFVIAAIGMGKLSGSEIIMSSPGEPIEKLQPLQQFFKVMAMSGLYWKFIGWTQIIAGALLMTQRYAKLGAVLFFPLILNIFVITVSYHFQGTPFITGLMLLAATFLILWDLNSFQFIFRNPVKENLPMPVSLSVIDRPYWSVIGVLMLVSVIAMALFKVNEFVQLLIAFAEGLLAFLFYIIALRNKQTV